MTVHDPERLESKTVRAALSMMLAQFMHGEEISFTAVPLGFDLVKDEAVLREVERQLEDEKRHHKMFDAQRIRLGLPNDAPNEPIVKIGEACLAKIRKKDVMGAVITGCFMLEGAAFSTLLTHSNVVDTDLSATFKEICADEARHIALNISVVQQLMREDPEVLGRLVELHRETLPLLFDIFTAFRPVNEALGIDNHWFTMRCLFHHSQRIRRLHLPEEAAKTMLADTIAVAQRSK
jgi:rubrerythrin